MSPKKRAPRNAKNKRGGGFDDLPVKVDEVVEVDVVDMSPNGEGIAKVRGYSIFIKGAKMGEHVNARITRLDFSAADAELA